MALAHVEDSELGKDHTDHAAPVLTAAPEPDEPSANFPVPAVTPRSAGHVEVVHPESNDHPPKMTPRAAVELLEPHVSLATVKYPAFRGMRDTVPEQVLGESHRVPADREHDGEHKVMQGNASPTHRAS